MVLYRGLEMKLGKRVIVYNILSVYSRTFATLWAISFQNRLLNSYLFKVSFVIVTHGDSALLQGNGNR
jgi:hypothetical protein